MVSRHFEDSLSTEILAGGAAGAAMSLLNCPIELVKVHAQTGKQPNIFKCSIDIMRKTGFINGLYRGYLITLLRDAPSFAAYFAIYNKIKAELPEGTLAQMLAGGMAGIAAWAVCYPQDVIKSRIQSTMMATTKLSVQDSNRRGIWHEISSSFRKSKGRCLWTGFGVCILRAFPANAATFATYELCLKWIEKFELQIV
jgi:solute carrier family 25 (mitochondrial carnitine/acylcarnitine transporter), member 20/29